MEDMINAREKADKLIKLVNNGVMNDIGDFIDSLNEEESKLVLRIFIYGDWKQLEG